MKKYKNHQNQSHKHPVKRHPILILAAIFLVAIITIGVFRYFEHQTPPEEQKTATTESNKTSSKKTQQPSADVKEQNTNNDDPFGKKPIQIEGEDPNNLPYYTGVVNYAQVSGDILVIRVTIDQITGSSGTCNLTLKSSTGQTYSASAPTFTDAAASSCQGFDIPVANLGTGEWYITVNIEAEGKTGQIEGVVSI